MPGVEIAVEFPELEAIRAAFRSLPKNISARYMAAALGRAIEPGLKALRRTTPRGPTGNLKRSIRKKTKRYLKTGAGVALAGYTAPPRKKAADLKANEKGYHQGFLEFGTKQRRATKKSVRGFVVASSYKRKQFAIARSKDGTVRTPKNSFFKAAKAAESGVDLGQMPIGGSTGKPPVRTAFQQTQNQIRSRLNEEMTKALNNALRDKFGPLGRKGKK